MSIRRNVLALVFALLAVVVVQTQGIVVPNTFVNGTVADADQVNANFSALTSNAVNRALGIMTGVLEVVAGTAGAPGLSGTADTTTGWALGSSSIGGSIAGTQRFLLNTSGLTIFGNTILDTSGKIPALNATYLSNLSAANLTSIPAAALDTFVSVAKGGTGAATLTANNAILGNGTSAVQFVAPGSNGNLLTSNGTTWTSAASPTLSDATLSTSDITTNDVSTAKHGFAPKAPNDTSKFLRGDASWAVPSGLTRIGGGSGNSAPGGASNLSTVSISGLINVDTLLVVVDYFVSSGGEKLTIVDTAGPTKLGEVTNNAALGASEQGQATVRLSNRQDSTTSVHGVSNGAGTIVAAFTAFTNSAPSAWTGSWTIGLRTDAADAAVRWSWNVYKQAGS